MQQAHLVSQFGCLDPLTAHRRRLLLACPLSVRLAPCLDRHAMGNLVEPAPRGFSPADRIRTPGQYEKHRLEGVFRSLFVAQQTTADAEDHRPMPADHAGEGIAVTLG